MSKRVYDRLKAVGIFIEPVKPMVGNLKSVTGTNFDISGAYRVNIKIGGYNNVIMFHVAASVSLDMVISYPQMRDLGWTVDYTDHALVIRRKKFGFLTQDSFERLTRTHGIGALSPVSLCAKMSLPIPPNQEAYVPVQIKGNGGVEIVIFEPDLAYIQNYGAYAYPGLVGTGLSAYLVLTPPRD